MGESSVLAFCAFAGSGHKQTDSNISVTDSVWKHCSFQRFMVTKDPMDAPSVAVETPAPFIGSQNGWICKGPLEIP